MSAGDNWCTHGRELDVVESICGVRDWDLDPASNRHSRVPAKVACYGGAALPVVPTLPTLSAFSGGRLRLLADGLSFLWPAGWKVWNNPPYSDPAPWVAQMVWHAIGGGSGVGLVPGCLDTFWGQAVLKARTNAEEAMYTVTKTGSARACAAGCAFTNLVDEVEAAGAPDCDLFERSLRWQVLMLRRRVSFIDPTRPWHGPVPGNRGSSMLIFWGFNPLTCNPELGEWL